ncbi:MAG TPA: hypothetical protein VLB11_04250 [Methyloceanibacter sp.]|nr:hypothetical protein [Methyloceanibacter sp.]
MVIRLVLLLGLSLALAAEATELEDGTLLFGEHNPMPAAVMALQDCGANERTYAKRRRFADGFIFAVKCASNHENWVETLIFSEHEDGDDGWVLWFPVPHKHGAPKDMLANINWYPDKDELGEIFVDRDIDRDDKSYCRSEGRWRLEGPKRTPKLVFWRETEDCDGKKGWVVLVGKK